MRDLWLGEAQGVGKLTDAKFFVINQQGKTTKTRRIRKSLEQLSGIHIDTSLYLDN
jgi:hypothetical protein